MALKSNFSNTRFTAEINDQADMLYDRILDSFVRAGENFIIDAREQYGGEKGGDKDETRRTAHIMGVYADDTKNLRNSIGYYIFRDGNLVKYGQGGKEGNNLELIQDVIIPNFKGFQLIGIAGMNYASHVESKGYNVISVQADRCILDLTYYLETLKVVEQGSAAQLEETFIP